MNYLLIIANIGLVLITLYTLYLNARYRTEPAYIQQIGNIYNFCIQEYQDKILNTEIAIHGSRKASIREIRNEIKNEFTSKNITRKEFYDSTLKEGNWKNKAVYQISICLERIGLVVLIGGIPIGYILASNGYQIVQDWAYCKELVNKKLRLKSPVQKNYSNDDNKNIYFIRRHGEWLAYAACVYMDKYWENNKYNTELKEYLKEIGDIDQIKKQEKKIRQSEKSTIPKNINKTIEDLLY